ncbi:hypothetical protein ACWGJB_07985 [Streptomyces sp. NPDC054813]
MTTPHEAAPHGTTAREAEPREATPRERVTPSTSAPSTPTSTSTPSSTSTAPVIPTAPVTRTASPALTLPTEPVVQVVPVVGETVRSVTVSVSATAAVVQELGDVVQQVTELPKGLVTLPVRLPALPALPGTSTTLPVSEPPGGSVPVPVTSTPGTTEARPAVTEGGRQQTARTKKPAATVGSYGPQGTTFALAPVPGTAAHTHTGGHRAARALDGPSRPAPTGDPDGALGKSGVDGSSSRYGDAYAVTFDDRAPLRLVPGATAHVGAAGTRDRYRDIPVFPG